MTAVRHWPAHISPELRMSLTPEEREILLAGYAPTVNSPAETVVDLERAEARARSLRATLVVSEFRAAGADIKAQRARALGLPAAEMQYLLTGRRMPTSGAPGVMQTVAAIAIVAVVVAFGMLSTAASAWFAPLGFSLLLGLLSVFMLWGRRADELLGNDFRRELSSAMQSRDAAARFAGELSEPAILQLMAVARDELVRRTRGEGVRAAAAAAFVARIDRVYPEAKDIVPDYPGNARVLAEAAVRVRENARHDVSRLRGLLRG